MRHKASTPRQFTQHLVPPPKPEQLPERLDIQYLTNAPSTLISFHSRLHNSHSRDAPLLMRLLTDQRMKPAWQKIDQRLKRQLRQNRPARHQTQRRGDSFLVGFCEAIPDGAAYINLWDGVVSAVRVSSVTPEPRRLIRDRLCRIGRDVKALAKATTSGPLNLLAYELLPDDVRHAFLKTDEGCERCRLLPYVSMTEVLEKLAQRAAQAANEEFRHRRLVDRNRTTKDGSANLPTRIFIRSLVIPFHKILGGPMPATLARFATVVFNTEVSEDIVRQTLRHFRI